ncbi:hypothetical protein [Burkholderia sp. LMG 32019]|uniref:hypothetical protein n=1 Tax=Burkholderia sp. LMG 32019 TaxID=3158173 RepID=UPI003C2BD967
MANKWMRGFCGAVLAASFGWLSVGVGNAAELTPIEVTNLYLKAIVNHDESAIASLNAYLRPARGGVDFASFSDLKEADAKYPEEITETLFDNIPIRYQQQLKPLIMDVMRSQYDALLSTSCRALDTKPAKAARGQEAVMVTFECQMVQVPESWSTVFRRLSEGKPSVDDYTQALRALEREYNARKTSPVRMDFPLARERRANAIWRNDFPTETTNKLFYPDD